MSELPFTNLSSAEPMTLFIRHPEDQPSFPPAFGTRAAQETGERTAKNIRDRTFDLWAFSQDKTNTWDVLGTGHR